MNNNCLFVYLELMARVFIGKEIIVGYVTQKSLVEGTNKNCLLLNIIECSTGPRGKVTPDSGHIHQCYLFHRLTLKSNSRI